MTDRIVRQLDRPADAVPRLALTKIEAATAIGVSVDFFEEHIQPSVRVVRRGRRVLIPVRELERWLDHEAALTIEAP